MSRRIQPAVGFHALSPNSYMPPPTRCCQCLRAEDGIVKYGSSDYEYLPPRTSFPSIATPQSQNQHNILKETAGATNIVEYPRARLLGIPSELRLMIYSMIDPYNIVLLGIEVRQGLAFRTRRNLTAVTSLHLAQSCKQIHGEVMEFYYDNVRATIDIGPFTHHWKECFPRQLSSFTDIGIKQVSSLRIYLRVRTFYEKEDMSVLLRWLRKLIRVLEQSEKLEDFDFEVQIFGPITTRTGRGSYARSSKLHLHRLEEVQRILPSVARYATRGV